MRKIANSFARSFRLSAVVAFLRKKADMSWEDVLRVLAPKFKDPNYAMGEDAHSEEMVGSVAGIKQWAAKRFGESALRDWARALKEGEVSNSHTYARYDLRSGVWESGGKDVLIEFIEEFYADNPEDAMTALGLKLA